MFRVDAFMNAYRAGYTSRFLDELDLQALYVPLPANPLVSVIVTTFNSVRYVDAALQSLLSQTHTNLEIIVVDDASTDDTRDRVLALAARDVRIRLLAHGGNKGTYWSKNFGITHSRGSVITFSDSDDINDPSRIQKQLDVLRAPGSVVSTCNYHKLGPDGLVMPQASARRFAFITQMMRRELFDIVGYFDSVRTSADDEMLNRIRHAFGSSAHVNVEEFLYTALVRSGSLSNNDSNPKYSRATGGLSPARAAYLREFTAWHARLSNAGRLPYMPFPLVRRPFPIDEKLSVDLMAETDANAICLLTLAGENSQPGLLEERKVPTASIDGSPDVLDGVEDDGVFQFSMPEGTKLGEFLASGVFPKGYLVFIAPTIRYSSRHVERLTRVLLYHDNLVAVSCASPDLIHPPGHNNAPLLSLPVDLTQERLVQAAPLAMVAFHSHLLGSIRQGARDSELVIDAPLIEVSLGTDSPRFSNVPSMELSALSLRSDVNDIEHPLAARLHDFLREKMRKLAPAFPTALLENGIRQNEEIVPATVALLTEGRAERPVKISVREGRSAPTRWAELSSSLRSLAMSVIRMWTRLELMVLAAFAVLAMLLAGLGSFGLWRLAVVVTSAFLFAIGVFCVFSARRTRLIHFPSQLTPELGLRSTLVRTLALWREWRSTQADMEQVGVAPSGDLPKSNARRVTPRAGEWRARLARVLRLSRGGRYAQVLASISEIEAGLPRRELEAFAGYALIARSLIFRRIGNVELSDAYLKESSGRGRAPNGMGEVIDGLSAGKTSVALIDQGLEVLISSLQEQA